MADDPWGPAPPPPPDPTQRHPDGPGHVGWAGRPPPRRVGAIVVIALLLVASLVAAAVATAVPFLSLVSPPGPAGGGGVSTVSRTPVVPPTTGVTSPPTPTPTRERTGREEPTRNPPPGSVSIVTGSAGDSCVIGSALSSWGGYPLASCRTWKASSGLLTGSALSRKDLTITCQADLGEQNPIFTAGQTNTWWVWTQADTGTWDWFPETAIAQGASDQPVNGVARCQ